MSLLCAWCGEWIRKEMPVGDISHGCCRKCADRLLNQAGGRPIDMSRPSDFGKVCLGKKEEK